MSDHGLKFEFHGIDEQTFASREDSHVSVLSGTNNCGKTLILKRLFSRLGEEAFYCGTNRYYSIEHFPAYQDQPQFIQNTWTNFRNQIADARFNNDPVVMPFHDVFIRMSDDERDEVYRICGECLEESVELTYETPDNSMSRSFLTVGGTPLAKCSSGTRMLVNLVSALLSRRFRVVLIDEPELGLTPRIQNAIQQLLFDSGNKLFAHLRHIYIATHSHVFLNRRCLSDNFIVHRTGHTVNVTRIQKFVQFRDLQFAQLGNSFDQLQLPSGFLIVEGKTDYAYLNRLLRIRFPETRISIVNANGDGQVKQKLHDLLNVVGKIDTSPYVNRVLVILDSRHTPSLKGDLVRMGLQESDVIVWSKNGIEYLYPIAILQCIFSDDNLTLECLNLEDDRVSHNGITMTKAELSDAVLDRLNGSEVLGQELTQFLSRVESFG